MNEEELLTETKKRKALLDEILKWNNHAIQQYYDELEKESTEPFAVLNQSINPADYIDTGIDEFEENLPELNILTDENLPIKIKSLTALTASEDKFQRYFNYLNEENSFNDYMKEMHTIFFRFKFLQESKEHFEFGDYCAYIIMDEVCKVYQKECSVDHIAFYARDFIFLLAYWLMPSDSSKTMQMIDYFKEIMNQNEKCQEHFNDFRNTLNEYRGIAYTPDVLYNINIVASVLIELANSTVSRKVKQYFLKIEDSHQLIDNLPEYSQKYRYLYEQNLNLTPYLHNMAIVFLFSYFTDPVRIAPYSAFAEYAKARILDKPDLKLNTIEEVLNNQATDTCSLNIRDTAKKLDELIETINDSNDSAVIDIFENVLTASQKNNDLYLPLPDFQEFIKQHYNQLIRVLMTFQKIDTDSIIQACIYFMLIEKFDTLAQFMPKDVSLVSSEVIKQKEENNLYLESRLADQEKVIMALQNQVKQQKPLT